jgi:hypothetical protein
MKQEARAVASPTFLRLPIDPADGFPQAFRLALAGRTYQFRLHANVAEELLDDGLAGLLELPTDRAFLVLTVTREGPDRAVILRRKLVPDVVCDAAELAVLFRVMRLDRRNLNGIGSFGSEIVGGVAVR